MGKAKQVGTSLTKKKVSSDKPEIPAFEGTLSLNSFKDTTVSESVVSPEIKPSLTTISTSSSPHDVGVKIVKKPTVKEKLIKIAGLYLLRSNKIIAIEDIDPHGSLAYDATGQAWGTQDGINTFSHSREYDIVRYLGALPNIT